MAKGLLGRKVGMTQVFDETGKAFPVTVIEALAAGCPVVATHVGGLPDLLEGGRYGTLVSSGNAHALAQAILTTLDSPPDSSAAQAAMLNQYGIDRLVSDLSALYKGLLAKKRK